MPSTSARERVESHPGWLGVEMRNLTRKEMQALGLSRPQGAQVVKVEANSPAAKAHLAPGDIIVVAGGRTIASTKQFFATIRATMPGAAIELSVLRRGQQRSTTAIIGTRPEPAEARAAPVTADAQAPSPEPVAPPDPASVQMEAGHPKPLPSQATAPSALPVQAQSAEDIQARNQQAIQLYKQGKSAEAIKFAEQTLALAEKTPGTENADTLVSIFSLGLLYKAQGRYGEAEPLFKRVLAVYEKALGPEDVSTLVYVDNLAALYKGQGRYGEAEALYKRAVAAYEKALGPDHPDTLSSVSDLAALHQAQERYGEAEPFYKRALAGRDKALGPEHADTLIAANNLAEFYRLQGRYGEAEPLHMRVLTGFEKTLGPEHPYTLSSVNNLAALYLSQGRYGDAEPLDKRALAGHEKVLGPEHPSTLRSLNNLAELYRLQGRYGEAEPLYGRALAGREKALGAENPETLSSFNNLATLYKHQGRYGEAEPLYKRALAGYEKALGRTHPSTLLSVGNLAASYEIQGRYGEAEPLYKRSLQGYEETLGRTHPSTLLSVNNLAGLYRRQGRYGEAEPLYMRALAGYEKALGPEHPNTLVCVNDLAALYSAQGRYGEAEPLVKRVLAVSEKTAGSEHPDTLASVNNVAGLYEQQGRYGEAESLHRRALAGREKTLGPDHPDTLASVSNLGNLYNQQGRHAEVEPLFKRALAGFEKVLGPEHPDTLVGVNNLGYLYQAQDRYTAAEALFKRALAGFEKTAGPDHPDTLRSVNNVAALYQAQGRHEEAEPLYKRALASYEKALGPQHPDTLRSVNNLGYLYQARDRYGEAKPLFERAVASYERALGPEHPSTLLSVSNLAILHFAERNWQGATQLWRRSTAAIAERAQRGAQGAELTGNKRSEAERLHWHFWGLVKAAYRLTPEGGAPEPATSAAMFQAAQWALSSQAAQSLAQMAVRGANGDPALAATVRERQDLVDEWQAREKTQAAALGQETAKRNAKGEAENSERMAAIDKHIAKIDAELKDKFPDYYAKANPAPLSIDDVQAQLGVDEALVLFLDTPESKPTSEETFIWVVTKTEMRWLRSHLGKTALAREVAALRCGLDAENWATASDAQHCTDLLGPHKAWDRVQPLPFDLGRAYMLYKTLIEPAEDLLKGKQLLIVPSGALTQLPFQVLVTTPPRLDGDLKRTAWLVRDHAISVLPAVSSLKALRLIARPSAADSPFIGVGNPLLDGPDDRYSGRAKLAREKQSCAKTTWQRVATLFGLQRGVTPIDMRSGLANVSFIREQVPLPETADELCAVADDLGADVKAVHLGAGATEHAVKTLNEAGELAHYRILHFATHGAMAGQLEKGSEPGLILTPPEKASDDDDGYLSASEVASLKLDADWVILSACNTAAGQATNAEALSGLARAFIYAGARALLVSHWAVDSNATVKLITTAMHEIAKGEGVGRAEALRRAMLSLIDSRDAREAHPAYWAPFVLVGEGAR